MHLERIKVISSEAPIVVQSLPSLRSFQIGEAILHFSQGINESPLLFNMPSKKKNLIEGQEGEERIESIEWIDERNQTTAFNPKINSLS